MEKRMENEMESLVPLKGYGHIIGVHIYCRRYLFSAQNAWQLVSAD